MAGLFVGQIEVRPSKTQAKPEPGAADKRRFELQFKLNVPRLVEGMEEHVVVQTDPVRPNLRRS